MKNIGHARNPEYLDHEMPHDNYEARMEREFEKADYMRDEMIGRELENQLKEKESTT